MSINSACSCDLATVGGVAFLCRLSKVANRRMERVRAKPEQETCACTVQVSAVVPKSDSDFLKACSDSLCL